MATTTCISGNPQYKKGNRATIVEAGSISDTSVNDGLTVRTLSQNKLYNHVYAAVSAASSGNLGTIKPFTSGSFAYQAAGKYVMQLIGTHISGVATSIFLGGANHVQQRAWNKIKTYRTSFLDTVSWAASRDGQPVYTFTYVNGTEDFLTDDSCLDLSELVYRTGKPLPVQADYQVKYSN